MSFLELFLSPESRSTASRPSFPHAEIHQQLSAGAGMDSLAARACIAGQLVERLDQLDRRLGRALVESGGAWRRHGPDPSEQTPVSDAVQAAREIADAVEQRVSRQVDEFSRVRSMPEPERVEPIDPGGGSATPADFLCEQSDKELLERMADAAEEIARRQYDAYREEMQR